MGHWYNHDAVPQHTIADWKTGEERGTTLRDARKLDLCPSSSALAGWTPQDGLTRWKILDHLKHGWRLMGGVEQFETWLDMVRGAAREALVRTQDEGTYIHDCMERIALGRGLPKNIYSYPQDVLQAMYEWWNDAGLTPVSVEESFCHPLGYGGKWDLIATNKDGRDVVVDYKSKETKGKRLSALVYRDSQPVQLVSYLEGFKHKIAQQNMFVNKPLLKTVIISRDEFGRIEEYDWPEDEYNGYWEEFKRRLKSWQWSKKFDTSWE